MWENREPSQAKREEGDTNRIRERQTENRPAGEKYKLNTDRLKSLDSVHCNYLRPSAFTAHSVFFISPHFFIICCAIDFILYICVCAAVYFIRPILLSSYKLLLCSSLSLFAAPRHFPPDCNHERLILSQRDRGVEEEKHRENGMAGSIQDTELQDL